MKSEETKISIIIPTYNVEEYISRTIESCISQDYNNMEILIIDDGSTDNTQSIINNYKKRDERIKVIIQKNSGVSVARNKGIENASGEWILFLDGDDWLEKDSLKKINKRIFMVDNNTDIIIFDYILAYNNSSIHESFFNTELKNGKVNYSKNDLIEACICKNKVSNADGHTNLGVPWGKVYNRKYLLDSNILFKIGLKRMQDMIFNLYAIYNSKIIYYYNDVIYHYRMQNLSVTKRYSSDFNLTAINILDCIEEFMNKYNLSMQLEKIYKQKIFFLFLEIIRIQYVPRENKKSFINKIKELHQLLNKKPFYYIKDTVGLELDFKRKIMLFLLKLKIICPIYLYYYFKVFFESKKYFKKENN